MSAHDQSTSEQEQRVVELLKDSKVAMLTYLDPSGKLLSKPMATQDVDFDGTLYFIAERGSDKVQALVADSRVNVSYSNNGSWVSVAGTASVVNDETKLKELWSSFTDSWLEGGPENPENVLVEVTPDSAEYWSAPGGSTIISLTNLVKAKLTGSRIEGDNEQVDLR
ncbi:MULTISPECIES: pyridoxamine 5'-phosphate oxidase family protein [Nocardioides]|uniref:Pyridoxamine 5'-phosphate oxidase family protein n=1 Tax=Nocardioides kribbensis TaxID=305517 RepID=A0ABV1NYS2_9ACTN|nr:MULTISPECIES: pyridoxamine 5'-phosphate oxidase family protein [Nocardioides]KQQ41817.1 pyridoxamine 5'-phosphate oxidase [Nocardioides sp. Leaf307]MCM3514386.1 pyridoxamine 5'-phosphate oxidase family protein [Nocardioides sp. P86]